jgi:hypothetical protein
MKGSGRSAALGNEEVGRRATVRARRSSGLAAILSLIGVVFLFGVVFLLGLAGSALAETYAEAVEGTVGVSHFWPMGESSGSSFADVVGGDDAEVSGGVALGEAGGLVGDLSTSVAFDGASGAAQAKVDLSGSHELTVEFWMKWHAFAGMIVWRWSSRRTSTRIPVGFSWIRMRRRVLILRLLLVMGRRTTMCCSRGRVLNSGITTRL